MQLLPHVNSDDDDKEDESLKESISFKWKNKWNQSKT